MHQSPPATLYNQRLAIPRQHIYKGGTHGRGIGSKIRKAVKKAVKKATDSLLRALKKLLKPITGLVTKIWDAIVTIFKFVVKVIRMIPKLFTPKLPNLMNMIKGFWEAIEMVLKGLIVVFKHALYLIRDLGLDVWHWITDAFPTQQWRNIDNIMGRRWVVGTVSMVEIARNISPFGIGIDEFANRLVPYPTFNSWSNSLGSFHGYILAHYLYRILVPSISGAIAVAIVSPIWLAKMLLTAPQLFIAVMKTALYWLIETVRVLMKTIVKAVTHVFKTIWNEITKPFRYYIDLFKDLL